MDPTSTLRKFRNGFLVALFVSLSSLASATDGTWITDGNGLWSNITNWSGGTVADGSGYGANFSTINITGNRTVSLDSSRSIGSLSFGDTDTATSFGWTLDNNATSANILTLGGGSPTITVNALGTANTVLTLSPMSVIISGVIAGSSGLTKIGDGRLKLTGAANTYTGGTVINGGKLSFLFENSLGATPGTFEAANITINNGGVLELTAVADADNTGANVTLSATRGITLGTGIQILQRNHRGFNFGVAGIIAGSGGLVLSTAASGDQGGGSGFDINGANTYGGDTYMGWSSGQSKGNAYRINNTLALQNSTLNYVNYFGFSENTSRENVVALPTNAILGGLAGGINASQVKSLAVPTGLKIGNNNQDTTFSGKLIGGGTLEKIGSGTLTLTGNSNSYTGATTVSAGTLALDASGTIASSASVTLGAVLDTTAKASYVIPAAKTYTFRYASRDNSTYILAEYTSLTGAAFASATVPAGYSIDYAHNGGTQIALVSGSGNGSGSSGRIKAAGLDITSATVVFAGSNSVTYDGNTSTGGSVPTDSGAYWTNDTVTVKANTGTLVRTGYTFAGWNTAANGTGTDYAASGSATFTMGAANVTLYAKWTINTYTVTYNGNGNTGGSAPVDASNPYNYNTTVAVKANTGTLVKTGYTFAGWNTAANGSGTDYAATGSAMFAMGAANVTLYAKWPVVSVTGTASGGGGAVTANLSGSGAPTFGNTQFIAAPPGTAPVPPTLPAPGTRFPYGMFSFTATGITPGGTITITLTYPQALPTGTKYWKYGSNSDNAAKHWYELDVARNNLSIVGNTVTFSITDGGWGDDDLAANGTVVDPGGAGVTDSDPFSIPALSEWMLALLALVLLGFGAQRVRRTR